MSVFKPPQITRIQVADYRVLRDLDLKGLRRFTVLVGPNGSGKSTLFDVFAFLSDRFTEGVRRACDNRGGLGGIRSRGASGPVAITTAYQSDVRIGDEPKRRTGTGAASAPFPFRTRPAAKEYMTWRSNDDLHPHHRRRRGHRPAAL